MPAIAMSKAVRISPRKVGEVVAIVRGRTVADALVILDHTPRRAALAVKQAIKSAGANAERNHNYRPDSLFISEISVTDGPRLKRYRAASRGMAHAFQRRTSHIRVVVDGTKREIKKSAPKTAKETK